MLKTPYHDAVINHQICQSLTANKNIQCAQEIIRNSKKFITHPSPKNRLLSQLHPNSHQTASTSLFDLLLVADILCVCVIKEKIVQ